MAKILKGLLVNGPTRTWKQLYWLADTKVGTFMGTDKFGNKYYENTEEDFGRERWVEFGNEKLFEASQIPPEWHMWMHAMNDSHPGNTKYVKKHWETEYQENLTGSKKNYVPYSTTVPKITAWAPKVAKRG